MSLSLGQIIIRENVLLARCIVTYTKCQFKPVAFVEIPVIVIFEAVGLNGHLEMKHNLSHLLSGSVFFVLADTGAEKPF